MEETTREVKDIARLNPLTIIGIPSKQTVVLTSRDSSADSLSKMQLCPAYRFCKELKKRPYRLSKFDDSQDQQIVALHDLLQAIKESAIRLIELIVNDIEERLKKKSLDSRGRYPESRRHEESHRNSELILATTASSVCALCGVALHLKPLGESEQFMFDKKEKDRERDVMLKAFDSMFLEMSPYKAALPTKREMSRGQEKIISKTQSIDTNQSELRSKLLFVQRIVSSEKISCQICRAEFQQRHDNVTQVLAQNVDSEREYNPSEMSKPTKLTQQTPKIAHKLFPTTPVQDASTLTHEMFCPCACGLLVKDGTESEVSIKSMSILKESHIKTY